MQAAAIHRRRPYLRPLLALAALALGAAASPVIAREPGDVGLHAASPGGPPATAEAAAGGLPVLTWHFFRDEPTPADGNLTESYARFEETLRFLSENGFRSVFPDQARGARARRPRQVVLTFDDGHKEHLRVAEILERHGFRGIFFVIPNRTRAESDQFLTGADVERLVRAGHRVAAHGYYHRSHPASGTEVAAAIVRSPRIMGARMRRAHATADFAFPFGHYTPEVAEALAGAYRYLHTVNPGYWDGVSPLVPRMLIMSNVDLAVYRDYVLGGTRYQPVLEPLTPDGAVTERVAFLARGGRVPEGVEMFAVSADSAGRSYLTRPLGESLQVRGDTLWVDIAAHLRRHHGPGRNVLGYALVTRGENGEMHYLSPGLLHWTRDPAVPQPPVPQPPVPQPGAGG